jgi:hypothetical protein
MDQITMIDTLFPDTSTEFVLMPSGDAEVFVDCGNCCGTASGRIDINDLRALRDFLNEHVKDPNDAEIMARATGSIGATYVEEHVSLDGTRTELSRQEYGKTQA